MNIAWFVVFRARARSGARLDAPDERALVEILTATPGLVRGLVFTPEKTSDPYLDDGAPPPLALELYFDSIDRLEAAIAPRGHLQALADRATLPSLAAAAAEQQAMLVRTYAVPDSRVVIAAGARPCTYLVDYPGPADDLNAWLTHYIDGHPRLMAQFPGIREIEICTRIDWTSALPWPRAASILRNKVMFDSAAALTAALNSPVRHAMREDFKRFPPFAGGNTHFPMATLEVRPSL